MPPKHLKLHSQPLRWGFTMPTEPQGGSPQGRLGGYRVGERGTLSLPSQGIKCPSLCQPGNKGQPQSSCPSAWPQGPRQNILSLGPSDISSSGSAIVVYDVTRNLWWNYYCLLFLFPAIYYSVYFQELWETFITKPKPGKNLFYLEFIMKSKHGLDFLKGSLWLLATARGHNHTGMEKAWEQILLPRIGQNNICL